MALVPSLPEPRDQLDALTQLLLEVSRQRDVASTLHVALRQCLDLTGSQFGFVGLVRPAPHEAEVGVLEIAAIHGFHPAGAFFAENRVIPLRPNIFNRVILDNRAVRTDDAASDPGRVGQPRGHPPVHAFLGVPLRLEGAPIGMIGLANRAGPYEVEHERLALIYAGLVAVLVHNAQLYEQLQQTNGWLERLVEQRTHELAGARDALAEKASRLQAVLEDVVDAQEQDRRRIAADLHDGVNQLLIGAMLQVTSALTRLGSGQPDGARGPLEAARDVLTQVEGEIRQVVHDLHPPQLEELGLPAAVRDVADRLTGAAQVAARVEVVGRVRRLPASVEISLYRIVQEALHNVASHARASAVAVRLLYEPDQVRVDVTDDGIGFDVDLRGRPAAQGRSHLGLESMRRRAESVGGRLVLRSAAGRGTSVETVVPVEPLAEQALVVVAPGHDVRDDRADLHR